MDVTTIVQKIVIWALPLAGRLTLNPIKHIDLVGTIIIPLVLLITSPVIFGWAKPVPVDARNLRHPRRDMVIVALAGPISNLLMAVIWAFIAKFSVFMPTWFSVPLEAMGWAGIKINIMLAVLNCLPIPPLDGGRAAYNLLPGKWAWYYYRFEPYGFVLLLILMFTGLLSYILYPPILFLIGLIVKTLGL